MRTRMRIQIRNNGQTLDIINFGNQARKSEALTLPRSGTEREVGGMISARRRKKTVRERRMEMERETFSPESEGR